MKKKIMINTTFLFTNVKKKFLLIDNKEVYILNIGRKKRLSITLLFKNVGKKKISPSNSKKYYCLLK